MKNLSIFLASVAGGVVLSLVLGEFKKKREAQEAIDDLKSKAKVIDMFKKAYPENSYFGED